jgi:hypothetical protein
MKMIDYEIEFTVDLVQVNQSSLLGAIIGSPQALSFEQYTLLPMSRLI